MKFTKMHGLGNDYVYINCFDEVVENPEELAKRLSNRNFGIGSDGIVLICESETADFKMRMFNSDGSESQMCGNAIRCVGKYVYDKKLTKEEIVKIETLAGIKTLELTIDNNLVSRVRVNMGQPDFQPKNIPLSAEFFDKSEIINERIEVGGKSYDMTCVSMGNPHAVVYVDDVDSLDLQQIGPLFENHTYFPERINTEFVEIIDKNTLRMRVWERGSGETLACGTGACAVLVASVKCGKSDKEAKILLKGGDLAVEWNEFDNCVYKTGSAEFVFDGELY